MVVVSKSVPLVSQTECIPKLFCFQLFLGGVGVTYYLNHYLIIPFQYFHIEYLFCIIFKSFENVHFKPQLQS